MRTGRGFGIAGAVVLGLALAGGPPVRAGAGPEKARGQSGHEGRMRKGGHPDKARNRAPVIARALPDQETGTLLIQGWHFGELPPIVSLAGVRLVVDDFGPQQVLAALPEDVLPGSHELRLTQPWPPWRTDVFEVTIGAVGPEGSPGEDGAPGPEGPIGPIGPEGQQGDPGDPGADGAPGRDGATWTTAPDAPDPADGRIGDLHLNETTGDVSRREDAGWVVVANIVGPQGPDGAPGEKGDDGAPGQDGADGGEGPIGPIGPPGPQGDPGEPGPAGQDGATWTTSPMPPAPEEGFPGDLHLEETTGDVYRRDESAWAVVANLVGAEGPQGLPGADGDPGEKGDPGDPGEPGQDGADGAPGPVGPRGADGPLGPPGPPGPPGADAGEPESPPLADPFVLTATLPNGPLSATGWLIRSDEPLGAFDLVDFHGGSLQPSRRPPGPVIFEREASPDRQLYDWYASTLAHPSSAASPATLESQSQMGTVIFSLTFQDALPVEWGIHLYPDGTYAERIVLNATAVAVTVPN